MKLLALILAAAFACSSPVVDGEATRIPFRLTKWNNVSVPSTINENYALNLMFHTAVSDVSIVTETLDKLSEIALDEKADVTTWGGTSKSRFGKGLRLAFGSLTLENATVFESARSGHQTDGKFGPSQLDCKFIEINFDRSVILLHPKLPKRSGEWKVIHLQVDGDMLSIDANLEVGEQVIEQRFCLHSGYSGFALLDDEFVSKHTQLAELEILEENELTDSAGNVIKTKKASIPKFSIDEFEFERTPVSFFEGALGRQRISLLGGDFLKRFNLLFDLENGQVYLKKSQHFGCDHF